METQFLDQMAIEKSALILLQDGIKDRNEKDHDSALSNLSDAICAQSSLYGQNSIQLVPFYYIYSRVLIENSQKDTSLFGGGLLSQQTPATQTDDEEESQSSQHSQSSNHIKNSQNTPQSQDSDQDEDEMEMDDVFSKAYSTKNSTGEKVSTRSLNEMTMEDVANSSVDSDLESAWECLQLCHLACGQHLKILTNTQQYIQHANSFLQITIELGHLAYKIYQFQDALEIYQSGISILKEVIVRSNNNFTNSPPSYSSPNYISMFAYFYFHMASCVEELKETNLAIPLYLQSYQHLTTRIEYLETIPEPPSMNPLPFAIKDLENFKKHEQTLKDLDLKYCGPVDFDNNCIFLESEITLLSRILPSIASKRNVSKIVQKRNMLKNITSASESAKVLNVNSLFCKDHLLLLLGQYLFEIDSVFRDFLVLSKTETPVQMDDERDSIVQPSEKKKKRRITLVQS